ncbi:MAG: efflux RND transporter periplasmic adaptor subunit [Chloroflexi bacterium]|nr:efflux RND transporter periplasmic adaptor subunit [Chloroflexota bacterium]
MKRIRIVWACVGLLVAVAIAGCSASATPVKPTPTASAGSKAMLASERIIAEGRVTPVKSAALSFSMGGTVAQVPVALGDQVEAGKVLAQLDTKQLELQLAQADANLASAQAKLNQLKRGASAEDLAAAQQNLTSAEAAYNNLLHPGANELAALKADVDKTKALLDQSQAAYDRVGGDSNPQSGMLPQRAQLQTAWLDFLKAQTLYNAKLNPTDAQIQQARAAIQTAKSQLAKLQPAAEDVAAAQANVNAAQAARDIVAEQIKNAKLVAPFAGAITTLDIDPGEFAAPGIVVLRLADTSRWQIETTDLTELNIVNVAPGMRVTMAFDAIPGLELPGKVTTIRPFGESKQGDIVYTVVVTPDQQDPRLRWNMTAKVTIEASK